MGRKRADLWRYAGREDKGFKCEFCEQFFKGGIVRLRSHLSGSRGQGIKVCNKVSKEAKTAALAELEAANNKPFMKKTKPETSSSNSDGISVTLNENCRDKVDNLLAKFFEENGIHSSIVESPSFINLVNALLKPGFSNYVLPSCSTLENQLIPCIRNEVEQYVSTAKQSWEATGCTVIIDIWSNEKEQISYVSIIACANKMKVLVNTFEIPINYLTGVFLEVIVHSVVGSIGVDCIVQCIVDDTPFGEVFSEFLARKCPRLCIIRCANRELQSFFYEVEKEVEWIRTTFETAKSLVDSICKEDDLLGLKQCSLGYDTLESILERKVELIKLVQSPEWLGQRESAKKVTEIIANQEFWKQGEEIQMVLNSLSKILHFDDAFDSGFGYLYGLVKIASQAIASLHTENPVKYQKLWDIFESKKGKIMNQTHKVAAFLNPAYMCSQIVQDSETDEAINHMLEKFVCGDDKLGFVKDAIHYRRTLSNTTQEFKIIAAKTSIPCEWWNEFGREFSVLSKYAVRILSQPCGSSSLKSSLRSFRDNQIKHRGFMPDLNALNLRINHFLMDKFSADKAYQSKIIDFEEFRQHKAIDDGSRDQVMEEARHSDEDTSLFLTSEEFLPSNALKIRFETTIASPIIVRQKVEEEHGSPLIYVSLVDSATNLVVQDGLPSRLTLTVSVVDGDFTNEGFCWTREHFDSNVLTSTMPAPLVTGDLQVMLLQGMGILGNFSFNYSSRGTPSGKFRLAVKTDTGDCQGIRTLEGISNAFVVEDCEEITVETTVSGDHDQVLFNTKNNVDHQIREHDIPFFGSTTSVLMNIRNALHKTRKNKKIIGALGWMDRFLIEELVRIVKEEENMFDEVLEVIDYSWQLAVNIQERFGSVLCIVYGNAGEQERAHRLRKALLSNRNKRLLLITTLKSSDELNAVGVPIEELDPKMFKLIVISTEKEALIKMGAQPVIQIGDYVGTRWCNFYEELDYFKEQLQQQEFQVETNTDNQISSYFGSETVVMNHIINALLNTNIQIIGLFGKEGIKYYQWMFRELACIVDKEGNLFDDIVDLDGNNIDEAVLDDIMDLDGNNIDEEEDIVEQLEDNDNIDEEEDIVEQLEDSNDSEAGFHERTQLNLGERLLKNKEKRLLLLILRDLDHELDLHQLIGIPREGFDPKLLKIILFSKNKEVLHKMNAQQVIDITNISSDELAYYRILDGYVERSDLRKLVDECGCDDLAELLAEKLKWQGLRAWENVFQRLKESPFEYEERKRVIINLFEAESDQFVD